MRPPSLERRKEAQARHHGDRAEEEAATPPSPSAGAFRHRPVWRAGPGLGKLEGAGGSTQVPAQLPAPRPLSKQPLLGSCMP